MDEQLITSQLASAALMVYLLQWVKRSRLIPWVTEHTKGLNRMLNAMLAMAAAVGIHYHFDAEAGQLVISGLYGQSIAQGVWEWSKQWAFQQASFDMIFAKTQGMAMAPDAPPGE